MSWPASFVVWLFVPWLLMGQPPGTGGPAPTLSVRAHVVAADKTLHVTLVYPRGLGVSKVNACYILRQPAAPDYEPRWCFWPSEGDIDSFELKGWPLYDLQGPWEVKAFLQWGGKTDKNGVTSDFDYVETPWWAVE